MIVPIDAECAWISTSGTAIACIVIVRDAAGRRRHLIIDADGADGLGNRQGHGRGAAEQDRRPARDRAPMSGR